VGTKTSSRFAVELHEKLVKQNLPFKERFVQKNNGTMQFRSSGALTNRVEWFGMASTMGDYLFFPELLRDPKILWVDLEEGDRLFGASDGVFDHLSSLDVIREVQNGASNKIPEFIVRLAMGFCLSKQRRDTVDNTSAFLADLQIRK
jgi:serine/threonine protein phosphatase PrpC